MIMVFGFGMALCLFMLEKLTYKIGFGGWLMNAYNYRVEEEDTFLKSFTKVQKI